ncbi:hypothetical protein SARC_07754 [Sphaeroforma arctica JP610]|uniref:Ribosome biogenesis protein SLX9 n=1 Tax=Sphaeroforma arctica JP610 TaxID=667725 RepID=A0A0L0FT49_9EUKA|nr:hypothetical protein SARC_07754 [Sphaeroforma arctica JP610]KNC79869.1 hypothetical protein SARC_07754 [Sphaeroforma arctica JP610]|eukprot:XP_014153771.1 hypothetical protein SARC_07754 [Sphaeroforma arctica JP610]
MGKSKKERKSLMKSAATAQAAKAGGLSQKTGGIYKRPTRLDKKIEKKASFMQKIEDSKAKKVKVEVAKKRKRNPLMKGGFELMLDSLGDIDSVVKEIDIKQLQAQASALASRPITSRKGRQYALVNESQRLQNIVSNSAYRANPLAALRSHLEQQQNIAGEIEKRLAGATK